MAESPTLECNDVRKLDAFEKWAIWFWPRQYIIECMRVYDTLQPKKSSEPSRQYYRRRQATMTRVKAKYSNCAFDCVHSECKQKRLKFYYRYGNKTV